MEAFLVSFEKLELAIGETNINRFGGGLLVDIMDLARVFLKSENPTMYEEGYDFATIYDDYEIHVEVGYVLVPESISYALGDLWKNYDLWRKEFIKKN